MPRSDGVEGRMFDNPISGERIVIRESGVQNDGRLLAFDLFLPPGGHVPARHLHPLQEERFTVVAGLMGFCLAAAPSWRIQAKRFSYRPG